MNNRFLEKTKTPTRYWKRKDSLHNSVLIVLNVQTVCFIFTFWFWQRIVPVLTPFCLLLCKVYLNRWIVNLVLDNFPPCLLFPLILLFLFSQCGELPQQERGCCVPSGNSLCCFWPLLSVYYRLSTYVKLFMLWVFHALYFLSLTVFLKPGVPILEILGTDNLSLAARHAILYVVEGKAKIVEA